MFTWRREAPDRRGNVWRVTPAYHVFIACVAGVKRGRGNLGALIPFAFPFERLPRRLMYLKNVIKLKWEIIWTGELPHLSRSPHPPRVPHLYVNRALNYPLMVFDVLTGDCVVNYVDLFWKSAVLIQRELPVSTKAGHNNIERLISIWETGYIIWAEEERFSAWQIIEVA